TTADDARRYRDAAEVEIWKQRDPLVRLRNYLTERKLWDSSKQEKAESRAKEEVAAAVKRAEEIAAPDKADFFNYMYAELPADLAEQRDTMRTNSLGIESAQGGAEFTTETQRAQR